MTWKAESRAKTKGKTDIARNPKARQGRDRTQSLVTITRRTISSLPSNYMRALQTELTRPTGRGSVTLGVHKGIGSGFRRVGTFTVLRRISPLGNFYRFTRLSGGHFYRKTAFTVLSPKIFSARCARTPVSV